MCMKLNILRSGILLLFIIKILLQVNKEILDRNFFRIDDILNTVLLIGIFYFIYIKKDTLIDINIQSNDRLIAFTLISTILIFVVQTISNLPYSFVHSDNIISSLTVNRMMGLSLNVYDSTWNEHTTLLIYVENLLIQLLNFLGFSNGLYTYFALFLIFSVIWSLVLVKVLSFYTNSLEASYIVASIFFLDLVASGNRVIRFDTRFLGSFLLLLFLFSFLSFSKNGKKSYLHFCVILGTLAIFNLESYAITIFLFFLTYLYITKPSFFSVLKLFLTFLISAGSIVLFHFQTGQLSELWNLNILFHLNSSRNEGVNILHAISGVEFFPGINVYIMLFFMWVIYVFKNRNFHKKVEILILNVYILGEILHLLLSGPRWIAYGQIMRVPLMIVLCVFIDHYLELTGIKGNFDKLKNSSIVLALLPFIIVTFIGGPYAFERKVDREQNILQSIESRNEVVGEISKYSNSKSYFLWTENKNWSWLFIEADFVPATRMWLWLQAYEEKKPYFSWNDRWGLQVIQQYWLEDIRNENTNIFVVDSNYISLPDFVDKYIINNTEFVKCVKNFCIYKK